MATALRLSFRFFFDANLWCQVSRTLLQYFQRYRLFSIFHFFVANRMTSSLHNRNISISLKRKKIFQKEKRHSSVFWKAFQISTKFFSFHRHFKVARNSFQHLYCDGSLKPLLITWCYNHGIKKLPNHWWTRCYHFSDTIGYHSNSITC